MQDGARYFREEGFHKLTRFHVKNEPHIISWDPKEWDQQEKNGQDSDFYMFHPNILIPGDLAYVTHDDDINILNPMALQPRVYETDIWIGIHTQFLPVIEKASLSPEYYRPNRPIGAQPAEDRNHRTEKAAHVVSLGRGKKRTTNPDRGGQEVFRPGTNSNHEVAPPNIGLGRGKKSGTKSAPSSGKPGPPAGKPGPPSEKAGPTARISDPPSEKAGPTGGNFGATHGIGPTASFNTRNGSATPASLDVKGKKKKKPKFRKMDLS